MQEPPQNAKNELLENVRMASRASRILSIFNRGWPKRGVKIAAVLVVFVTFLPAVLTIAYKTMPPMSTIMMGRIVTGKSVVRQWVPLERVSDSLVRAVIVSEDARFCDHDGIDWVAVDEVLVDVEAGKRPRGASTLTMQVARNLFLWPQRSYFRKGLELPLAYYLEWILGKRRIFEIYLNIAEWGPGQFGVAVISQSAFRKKPSGLSRQQSAHLATALPNPKLRNPAKPKRGHRALARDLQRRMKNAVNLDCLLR